MKLVELLDGLLPHLEADPGYAHFQLDGQLAVVDDYLEVRPHEADRIVRLNCEGRLSVGPWYTLPDEFLVSGETLVRNLRMGVGRAAEMGGSMAIGYLPDMFGHVAQMPQILAGFGFRDAVVWRGVPEAIDAPAFCWEAPDGTRVRATYLAEGYGNGARHPGSGAELVAQVAAFRAGNGHRVGEDVLWMNGTDHQLPQPDLAELVAQANDVGPDRYIITSLTDHLAAVPDVAIPTWRGELRSGARANLLMGVASCRVDVKQAAAQAERWLERVAEPLAACWLPPERWPAAFLAIAWKEVVRNAAHDSICGCSADEVNDAVLHRYAEATRVAEAVAERALSSVLAASGQPAIAVNPTRRERAAVVTAVLAGDQPPAHTQQISVRPALLRTDTLDRRSAREVLLRAAIEDAEVSDITIAPAPDASGDLIATLVADRAPKAIDTGVLRSELERMAADDPDGLVHLDVRRPTPTQQVLLRTAGVPEFGWRGLAPADLGAHAVRAEDDGLANGLVTVVPDQGDGTFSVDGLAGFGRLVDDGDAGDTYNWSPAVDDEPVSQPQRVEVRVAEAGPVRGRLEIERHYRWPTHVGHDGRRAGALDVAVLTVVELRAGEDLLRVSVTLDNRTRDHRLRVHLPLPRPAEHSQAECAFTTVRRGLVAEGGPNEVGLPTFPSRRFVSAGGLLVVHDGLCEYELVDVGPDSDAPGTPGTPVARSMAVTLLRSVGTISRGPMAMRSLPAGPPTPTPGAQMPGARRAEFVVHLGGRDPYAVADEAFTPILTAHALGNVAAGDIEAHGQALAVEGAEVSALGRSSDGRLDLRVVETNGEPGEVLIPGRRGIEVTLGGEPTGTEVGGRLDLRPHQIATLLLDEPSPAP